MEQEIIGRARGGKARAAKLSRDERTAIARKAATMRWADTIPRATHEGTLKIGDIVIPCAVLNDGKRVITQSGFLRALGRSKQSGRREGDTGEMPTFLTSSNLQPFIHESLTIPASRIEFIPTRGARAYGYSAELLPAVCEVFMDAERDGVLLLSQKHILERAKMLLRGLARVGIVGLIDEATGFQKVRDREALQALLNAYLSKELVAWAKRFPDEFYDQIIRLKGWERKPLRKNPPQVVGKYTNDIIYDRLAPEILKELEKRNPKDERGYRKAKHHQWLTVDIGHPELSKHLYGVIGLMRVAPNWEVFMKILNRAYPKKTIKTLTQAN